MKKILTLLLVALFGAAPLFADDAADVKATILKDLQLIVKGDFKGSLELYATDYQETDAEGVTFNYDQHKWMLLALDGKHPEEFWRFLYSVKHKGALPPSKELSRLDRTARTPEYVELYKKILPELVAGLKAEMKQILKTIEFVSVKVDGDQAVAVVEYDNKNAKTGATKREIETFILRKKHGKWLFYRSVSKYK